MLKKGLAIYEPKGRAGEYALAATKLVESLGKKLYIKRDLKKYL